MNTGVWILPRRDPFGTGFGPSASPSLHFKSKLAAPMLGPALHHHLGLGVELHAVVGLGVQVAEETLSPTAERKLRHGCRHADVDSDVAGRDFVPELPRRGAIR